MKCVFKFSLQFQSEAILVLRRIQWYIIIYVHMSSCKRPVFLVRL